MKLLILDDSEKASSIDRANMLGVIENFPNQCQEAIELGKEADLNALEGIASRARSVLVLGMGGSGVSGDLARTLLEGQLRIPMQINKSYQLPGFAGEDTLVFAVSYSGNTEETLSGFDQAVEKKCRIVCITTGGKLAEKAENLGFPIVRIPSGIQPRAALGYLFFPIMIILERLGFIPSIDRDMEETVQLLHARAKIYCFDNPIELNAAKAMAARLYHMVPVVYGFSGLTDSVAFRWKCQFNENTKIPAMWNTFPELNHNETVSWELLENVSSNFTLLLLRDKDEPRQIRKRMDITEELIEESFGGVETIWTEGISAMTKMLSLIYLGDFVSTYLALLYKMDPSPVKRINVLKERLAE